MSELLGLSQEQVEQLKPILERRQKTMMELRGKLFGGDFGREDFRAALKVANERLVTEASPHLDGDQVKKLTESQSELFGRPRGPFGRRRGRGGMR